MKFLVFLALFGVAFSQSVVEIYEAGRKKGFEEGFKAGIEKAIEYFREVYQEKLQEYQEIEAGKLLIKEGRISYPRVYTVRTPEGVKVIVEGCKVIAPVDDLLDRISSVRYVSVPEREKPNVELFQRRVKVVLPESALEDVQKVPSAFFFKHEGLLYVYVPESQAKRLCEIYTCREVEK